MEALRRLQEVTSEKIVLFVIGKLEVDKELGFEFRCLGRLGEESYNQFIKLADVICAPGVPNTFNKYRLSSRLVKGLMYSKPIFSFKTGYAESLVENQDGFFKHTGEVDEWVDVLKRTLCKETRVRVGARGREIALEQFDAARITPELAETWKRVVCGPSEPEGIMGNVLSKMP
ncbi:hypothetical protein [Luteolibacter sp. AS25]|uniref:hypothetical protein n=1 Tax=Luteolibacter sp. AS25 TaxID=3135776 RepID=UPI00398B5E27